jgi:hypothetical protein
MGVVSVVFGTLLFGFLSYGIVSFYYDVKRQVISFHRTRRERVQSDHTELGTTVDSLAERYDSPNDRPVIVGEGRYQTRSVPTWLVRSG